MHIKKLTVASVFSTLILLLTFAQTTATCQPLNQTCPSDEGLASNSYFINFTKTKSVPSDWSLAAYENVNFGAQGAELTFAKRFDSPTIYTNFKFLFGHIDYVAQAAPGRGIISSMVLLSDDLDEIDWEIIGVGGDHVETNYFGKGAINYNVAECVDVQSPQTQFHTYSLDWSPEQIVWSIDGVVKRTLTPSQAGNEYPQTPMKVSLSLWDAGDPNQPVGTMQWAGGETQIPPPEPYTMYVKSVKITNATPAQQYQYTDKSGSYKSIKVINKDSNKTSSVSSSSSIVASIPRGPTTIFSIPTASSSSVAATLSSVSGDLISLAVPKSTHDFLKIEIIHTTVTSCPVTRAFIGNNKIATPIVTSEVTTVFSTSISTICTKCVAFSPSASVVPFNGPPTSAASGLANVNTTMSSFLSTPQSTHDLLTAQIVYSTVTSCPITKTISDAHRNATQIVTSGLSTIFSTSVSTICTECVAPSPSTSVNTTMTISPKTQAVVTTEIVASTVTKCPITSTISPAAGTPTQHVTTVLSTLCSTSTSTICNKCIAPVASIPLSLSYSTTTAPSVAKSLPATTASTTSIPQVLFTMPPPSAVSALASSMSRLSASAQTLTSQMMLSLTSTLTASSAGSVGTFGANTNVAGDNTVPGAPEVQQFLGAGSMDLPFGGAGAGLLIMALAFL